MNSRQRILLALNHQEPDRVPLFAPNIIRTDTPYPEPLQHFLDAFPFDQLVQLEGLVNAPAQLRELADGTLVDGYGCRFKYMGVGLPYCIYSPLAQAESIADVTTFAWPDPNAPGLIAADIQATASALHAAQQSLVAVEVKPLFHQYHYLRGFEQWMIDIKLNQGLHQALADHLYHLNLTLLMRLLDQVAPYVDLVMTFDDFGTSTATYMAPQDFRTLIKPYYQDMIARIKGRYPNRTFYLHSHGQIMALLPDMIECGVDVLNPILPLDNMDPVRLKTEFGRHLCFHGGVDIEHILPFGAVADVRDHVRRVIDILAPGGGFWFKAQAISPLIPPQNLITAYQLALEYGRY